jgi:hypothetical protein
LTRFHHFVLWPLSQDAELQLTNSTFSCTPYVSVELKRGRNHHFNLQMVHPRGSSHLPLRCCFGFLHTQEPNGFDELCNIQGAIQNRSTKINITAAYVYLPASCFRLRNFRIAKVFRGNGKWCFLAIRMQVKTT